MGAHARAVGPLACAPMDSLSTSLKELLGPDGWSVLSFIYWQVLRPLYSQPSMHWVYLLASLALACLFYLVGAGVRPRSLRELLGSVFPREVWAHPSTRVDWRFFVVNQILIANLRISVWVIGLVGLLYVQQGVQWLGSWVLPAPDPTRQPGAAAMVAFTLAMGIGFDFSRYLSHRLHHRIPMLWEFHKVHHSAEVLTMFSNYRNHPVETAVELALRLIAVALIGGIFGCFYPSGLVEITILNLGGLAFVYYLTAHLRHSHVPFDFGRLRKVFISPRMHQLHHSADPKHFDRNFGFMLSIWDQLAGTLYLPHPSEKFALGLPPEAGRFDSAWNLYVQPFIACWRMLRDPASAPVPVPSAPVTHAVPLESSF